MTEREIQLAIISEIRSTIVCAAPNYTPSGWWECDLWAVTKAGYTVEYEIKLTASDFRADAKKANNGWSYEEGRLIRRPAVTKHQAIEQSEKRPSRFFYVMPSDLANELESEIPEWAGLGKAQCDGHYRRVFFTKSAPKLNHNRASVREIRLCQRRMWYRYWEALRSIEDLKSRVK